MSASLRPSNTPRDSLVHKKSLIGFRSACERMWGATGYQALCEGLPPDVRDRTAGMRPLPDWIPLDDLIAWHITVWNGPAKRDETLMTKHIQLTVDQGFGRVKRILLGMATPQSLAPRVVALWRDEYSTGRLEATTVERQSVQLALRKHPYVEHALMRFVIAEVFRYVLSLTNVDDVTAVHAVRDGSLVVVLRWI
ncbi:MAG TPA: hypothetical protein VH142_08985 [Polyangiaceae bacterium]|nr:hypothetical protein [Polyangiaceae bacterium]